MDTDPLQRLSYFLRRHWHTVLATTSLVGFLTATLVPGGWREFQFAFAVLAANTVIWMLVDIKSKLEPSQDVHRFESLPAARASIIAALTDAVRRRGNGAGEIMIIGGRLRTISELLLDFFEALPTIAPSERTIRIRIACVDPRFLDHIYEPWPAPPESHLRTTVRSMESSISELLSRNGTDAFKKHKVSIVVERYTSAPSIYSFLIDNRDLFWGYYTWSPADVDFKGPTNPCYRHRYPTQQFSDLSEWITSEYQTITRPPTLGLGVLEESSFSLPLALRMNLYAFNELASEYAALSPRRENEMRRVLEPVLDQVASGNPRAIALDLGAADGYISSILSERLSAVHAVEFAPEMVSEIRNRALPNVTIIQNEFLNHDFGEDQFDLVVAVAFIHLFPSATTPLVLSKICSLLRPGGLLFLSTTAHDHPEEGIFKKSPPNSPYVRFRRRITESDLRSVLGDCGLEVVEHDQNSDALVPNKLWSGFLVARREDRLIEASQ